MTSLVRKLTLCRDCPTFASSCAIVLGADSSNKPSAIKSAAGFARAMAKISSTGYVNCICLIVNALCSLRFLPASLSAAESMAFSMVTPSHALRHMSTA